MSKSRIKWYTSLYFQTFISLVVLALGIIVSLAIALNAESRKVLFAESSRLVQQTANNAVSDLDTRSREIATLTRTLGVSAEKLPKSETDFKNFMPPLINFQGDKEIAGGGVWPEPYAFDPKVAKRSFYWSRELDGSLKYYDDYNQKGYHNESWYVVARYLEPGKCFWSESYIDSYTQQPMVSCTVTMQENGKFYGAVTIDWRLESLQAFTESWQKKTGGYLFIVDQYNRFITFPYPKLVKRVKEDSSEKSNVEILKASEFAAQQPLFLPISSALEAMNLELLRLTQKMPNYKPEIGVSLAKASSQIDQEQGKMMSLLLAEPWEQEKKKPGFLTNLI